MCWVSGGWLRNSWSLQHGGPLFALLKSSCLIQLRPPQQNNTDRPNELNNRNLFPTGWWEFQDQVLINSIPWWGLYCWLQFSSVQLASCVWLFTTPWTTARQAPLSTTNSQSLPRLMPVESVMPCRWPTSCFVLIWQRENTLIFLPLFKRALIPWQRPQPHHII